MLFQQANTMTRTSTACTLLINPRFPDSHCSGRESRNRRERKKKKNIGKVGMCSFPMQQTDSADSRAETIETETNGGAALSLRLHQAEIDGDTGHNGSANFPAFSEAR